MTGGSKLPRHEAGNPRLSYNEYFFAEIIPPPVREGKGTGLLFAHEKVTPSSKEYKGDVWLAGPDFPLHYDEHLLPILDALLRTRPKALAQARALLDKLPPRSFCLKIDLPVFPTVHFRCKVTKYETRAPGSFPADYFLVPESFSQKGVDKKKQNKKKKKEENDSEQAEDDGETSSPSPEKAKKKEKGKGENEERKQKDKKERLRESGSSGPATPKLEEKPATKKGKERSSLRESSGADSGPGSDATKKTTPEKDKSQSKKHERFVPDVD
jgi:hypothetical protein